MLFPRVCIQTTSVWSMLQEYRWYLHTGFLDYYSCIFHTVTANFKFYK